MDDGPDDAGDLVVGEPVAHGLEGFRSCLSQVHVRKHAAEFLGDRMPLEFLDCLGHGAEQGRAGLHQERQQIEQEGDATLDQPEPSGSPAGQTSPEHPHRRQRGSQRHGHSANQPEQVHEEIDVKRRSEHCQDFGPGQVFLGQPEPRQAGSLDLPLDFRQDLAKQASIEAGQHLDGRLEDAIQGIDGAQLVDPADVVPPLVALLEVFGLEHGHQPPDTQEHGHTDRPAGHPLEAGDPGWKICVQQRGHGYMSGWRIQRAQR